MKRFNYAISIGCNVTNIYKAGVGVVLSDKTALVTTIKNKKEVAFCVGEEAISSGLEYKRVVSDGRVDFSLAVLLLEEFFKKIEISKKDGVLFLVALEDMSLTNEYKNLAYALGINNVEVIPSIVATTYGFEIEKFRKSFLLCDIGVNTEIAIINNGRIVTGATINNGGKNIDDKIAQYIYEKKGIELSIETAEQLKNELATLLPNDERTMEISGFIKNTTDYTTLNVTSREIFGMVVEEYDDIASAIIQVLASCNNDINDDIKKHGIYICGASSKIVGLEKFFKLKTGLDSYIYKPDTVTMIGAGQLLDSPQDVESVVVDNAIYI